MDHMAHRIDLIGEKEDLNLKGSQTHIQRRSKKITRKNELARLSEVYTRPELIKNPFQAIETHISNVNKLQNGG